MVLYGKTWDLLPFVRIISVLDTLKFTFPAAQSCIRLLVKAVDTGVNWVQVHQHFQNKVIHKIQLDSTYFTDTPFVSNLLNQETSKLVFLPGPPRGLKPPLGLTFMTPPPSMAIEY